MAECLFIFEKFHFPFLFLLNEKMREKDTRKRNGDKIRNSVYLQTSPSDLSMKKSMSVIFLFLVFFSRLFFFPFLFFSNEKKKEMKYFSSTKRKIRKKKLPKQL